MSEVDVQTEIVIARPRAAVAAYAADPANAPEWYVNIDSVEIVAPERMTFTARFLGRTLVYTYEVREHLPGERYVMSTEQGPFPMETTYAWADAGDGATAMTLRNRGEPSGFAKVGKPMMEAAMRRANRRDLERLKRILEAGG